MTLSKLRSKIDADYPASDSTFAAGEKALIQAAEDTMKGQLFESNSRISDTAKDQVRFREENKAAAKLKKALELVMTSLDKDFLLRPYLQPHYEEVNKLYSGARRLLDRKSESVTGAHSMRFQLTLLWLLEASLQHPGKPKSGERISSIEKIQRLYELLRRDGIIDQEIFARFNLDYVWLEKGDKRKTLRVDGSRKLTNSSSQADAQHVRDVLLQDLPNVPSKPPIDTVWINTLKRTLYRRFYRQLKKSRRDSELPLPTLAHHSNWIRNELRKMPEPKLPLGMISWLMNGWAYPNDR